MSHKCNNIPDPICVKDKDRIIQCNPVLLWKQSKSEIVGKCNNMCENLAKKQQLKIL